MQKLCEQESIPVGFVPPARPPYVDSHQISGVPGQRSPQINRYPVLATRCLLAGGTVIKLRRKVPHSPPHPPNLDHYVPRLTIHIFHSYVRSALFYQTFYTYQRWIVYIFSMRTALSYVRSCSDVKCPSNVTTTRRKT